MPRLIASFFGVGLLLRRVRGADIGSGTLAALVALPAALALGRVGVWAQVAAAAASLIASLTAPSAFVDPEDDPGWVVIDEVAGTFVATIGLGGVAALAGWAMFRVADILKPLFPGVAAAERLPGAWGITADDFLAGLYGLGAGWLVHHLIT